VRWSHGRFSQTLGRSYVRKQRIVVLSHNHPRYFPGGGEIAAYNLFKGYREAGSVQATWFLARHDRVNGRGSVRSVGQDEYIWEQKIDDWLMLRSDLPKHIYTPVLELITALEPTILHAHHYSHIGLDFFCLIREMFPKLKIIMTLHEYMAICHHNGQMIDTHDAGLCWSSSISRCASCFPKSSKEEFWLRKDYITQVFDKIDAFVSPSEFLRQRYISWGIDPGKIITIENLHLFDRAVPARPLAPNERRRVFGFFGQINPYKGFEVLLDAVGRLPHQLKSEIVIRANGANLEMQSEQFQRQILDRLSQPEFSRVQVLGPYTRDGLADRMAQVDWVVIPSTWWENSPMVIQEAFHYGRPVICAGLGGMAEKVRDGIDGLHFKPSDAADLALVMERAVTEDNLWQRLVTGIKHPPSKAEIVDLHLTAFKAADATGSTVHRELATGVRGVVPVGHQ
jgi:glycosyltransferase involved in cell wall biosynthesis